MIINFKSVIRVIVILTALYSNSIQANELQKFKSLKKAFTELNFPAIQLDFEHQISNQLNNKYSIQELNNINEVLLSSENINTSNFCDLIEYEKIKFDLKKHKTRHVLLNQQSDETFLYTGSIYNLTNHKQWYQLLMKDWLGADINPKELKKIGEDEFKKAHEQLTKIKRHAKDKSIPSQQSQAIEKSYRHTEKTVMAQINKLFPEEWNLKPVKIERSDLGNNFPAPGFYNMESETFFYNPLEETYNLSQIDWLFIHEAVPGHHFQNKISNKYGVCNQQLSIPSEMAFTEGWAAYTETLGTKLGLYKDPNSLYFALKWQALRAMRVIIDVGIHAQGWSVKQAESYWLLNFPEGKDVMNREIERIQKWPMQVNTYVYGKYKIEQLKIKLKQQGEEFNEIEFHKNIILMSQLPLASLNYYPQLFKNRTSNRL